MPGAPFKDRRAAGRRLAERLLRFRGDRPVVLALPRGGVAVGFEVAEALGAPLDVVLVRKIGVPFQPELALGAVVDGGQPETVLNRELVRALGIPEAYLAEEAARQLEEMERRRRLYLAGRPRPDLAGRTALVVDDGIATGATVRAALHAVRRARPGRLVLAVPVAPPEAVEALRAEADEVVCLIAPRHLGAIGAFFEDFHQMDDAEVIDLLRRAPHPPEPETAPPTP